MNPYVTGQTIQMLREKRRMTQKQLADLLYISDKTVSKWETGKGLPDIMLLEPLAKALHVSVPELFSGTEIVNQNRTGNCSLSVSCSTARRSVRDLLMRMDSRPITLTFVRSLPVRHLPGCGQRWKAGTEKGRTEAVNGGNSAAVVFARSVMS